MSRNVFLSVLGTGYYLNTKYENALGDVCESRFIQIANLSSLKHNWSAEDIAFIFVTEKSKQINYLDVAHPEDPRGSYNGLSNEIESLGLPFQVIPITIPDGNNETEIWDIFYQVFAVLEYNDNVFFDITHSFRSIPMLIMVMIQYAKFLKNINVQSISYGNFESKNLNGNAKIVDLIAFSELQDWTIAAADFVKFGNLSDLSNLVENDKGLKRVLIESKGGNTQAVSIKTLFKKLNEMIENIQTNRSKYFFNKQEFNKIFDLFEKSGEGFIPVLKPILIEIKKSLKQFEQEDDILRGIEAVKWANKNNYYQQTVTLLQELCCTFLCLKTNLDPSVEAHRNDVNSIFIIIKKNICIDDWKVNDKNVCKRLLQSPIINDFFDLYLNLKNLRNDLNHAGMNSQPMAKDKIIKNTNLLTNEITNLILKNLKEI